MGMTILQLKCHFHVKRRPDEGNFARVPYGITPRQQGYAISRDEKQRSGAVGRDGWMTVEKNSPDPAWITRVLKNWYHSISCWSKKIRAQR